jgi:hypothetical protein
MIYTWEGNRLLHNSIAMQQLQRYVVNVSGTKFNLHYTTLAKLPQSSLEKAEVFQHSIENKSWTEYYFEGDPDSFSAVLWYFTHGELHVPVSTCAMIFQQQMVFWGLDVDQLAPCCVVKLATYMEDHALISKFQDTERKAKEDDKPPTPRFIRWERLRAKVWLILDNPCLSAGGKVRIRCVCVVRVIHIYIKTRLYR